MSDLTLKLIFEGATRMGTGQGGSGLDEVIDSSVPLSASGIKGVLRDEARLLLTHHNGEFITDHPFVTAVFGGPGRQTCPWNFDIAPDETVSVTSRANLQLNDDGSVVEGALLVKEEAWITSATLRLFQRGPLRADGLPVGWQQDTEKIRQAHLALISIAARLVDKVGQRKTRGMGWLVFAPDPSRILESDLDLIQQIKEAAHG